MFDSKQLTITEKDGVISLLANRDAYNALVEFVKLTSKFKSTLIYTCYTSGGNNKHECNITNVERVLPNSAGMYREEKDTYRLQTKVAEDFRRFLFLKETGNVTFRRMGSLWTKFERDAASLMFLRAYFRTNGGNLGILTTLVTRDAEEIVNRQAVKVVTNTKASIKEFDSFLATYGDEYELIVHVPVGSVSQWRHRLHQFVSV